MPIEQGLSYCYVVLWVYLLIAWRIRLKYRLYLFLSNLFILALWKLVYMKFHSIHCWFFFTAMLVWLSIVYFLIYHESGGNRVAKTDNREIP